MLVPTWAIWLVVIVAIGSAVTITANIGALVQKVERTNDLLARIGELLLSQHQETAGDMSTLAEVLRDIASVSDQYRKPTRDEFGNRL